jgi:hypothetical protein
MVTRWTVPSSQQRTRHEDGHWLVYDDDRAACWQVTPGVADVLESLVDGWQPGAPLPPRLQPFALTDADAATLVADLVRQELVLDTSTRRAAVRPPRRMRLHLTCSLLRAPVIAPAAWRLIVMALAAAAVAAAALIWSQLPVVPGETRAAFLGRLVHETLMNPAASTRGIAEMFFYWVLLATIHEHAHAFALSSRIGRPVTVGLRLIFWVVPRPFADVTALVTLPRRRDRIPVLLAGPLVEFTAWLVVLAVLGSSVSRLGLPFILLGPAILLVNLLPLVRNDGYLVLQEFTGDRDLVRSARRAAHAAFLSPDPPSPRSAHAARIAALARVPQLPHQASLRWWLPWYGLIELAFVPALLVVLGVVAGTVAASSSAGAVCGAAAGLSLLMRRVRGIDVTAEEWPGAHAA